MLTEWFLKAALTALAVWFVLRVADRCGPRLGGLAAALPTVTAPTLLWVAHEQGARFAAGAAIGSVAACAVLAAFALAYALTARRRGSAVALLAGLGAVAITALPALALSASLALALAAALGAGLLANAAMRAVAFAPPTSLEPQPQRVIDAACLPESGQAHAGSLVNTRRRDCALERLCVAVTVGATTALIAALGPALGDYATGLLASLPLIGGAVAVLEQWRGGAAAAAAFLRGYVAGLFGRAAFGATFALAAPSLGVLPALLLAVTAAALLSVGARHPVLATVRRPSLTRAS